MACAALAITRQHCAKNNRLVYSHLSSSDMSCSLQFGKPLQTSSFAMQNDFVFEHGAITFRGLRQ